MRPRSAALALLLSASLGLAGALSTGPAAAEPRVHTVAENHTLGKIAKRYHTTIEAICHANGIARRDRLKLGQKLVIPERDDRDGERARAKRFAQSRSASERSADKPAEEDAAQPEIALARVVAAPSIAADQAPDSASSPKSQAKPSTPIAGDGMHVMSLPGGSSVYYYEPVGPGRLSLKPVLVYLHGKGGNARADCRRWAPIVRRLGWLACPTGPVEHNAGRAWGGWPAAHQASVKTINGLRQRYGRRVQLFGNTLIGFSEGAFAAMNVGVREPRTFNRLLILAAKETYWGGPGIEALGAARARMRRVYLITGERDGVVDNTRRVRQLLSRSGVATRITTPSDLGHELALERKPELYRMALVWLDRGPGAPPREAEPTAANTHGR